MQWSIGDEVLPGGGCNSFYCSSCVHWQKRTMWAACPYIWCDNKHIWGRMMYWMNLFTVLVEILKLQWIKSPNPAESNTPGQKLAWRPRPAFHSRSIISITINAASRGSVDTYCGLRGAHFTLLTNTRFWQVTAFLNACAICNLYDTEFVRTV